MNRFLAIFLLFAATSVFGQQTVTGTCSITLPNQSASNVAYNATTGALTINGVSVGKLAISELDISGTTPADGIYSANFHSGMLTWVLASGGGSGTVGPQGPAGPQGPKGDTGATGAQGPAGSGSGSTYITVAIPASTQQPAGFFQVMVPIPAGTVVKRLTVAVPGSVDGRWLVDTRTDRFYIHNASTGALTFPATTVTVAVN